nr:hypothetical protein [Tanacetum cinerariifolium]
GIVKLPVKSSQPPHHNAYEIELPGEYNVSGTFNVADVSMYDIDEESIELKETENVQQDSIPKVKNPKIGHCMVKPLFQIVKGNSINFWNDDWLGDFSLASTFLRLYILKIEKDCSLSDRLLRVGSKKVIVLLVTVLGSRVMDVVVKDGAIPSVTVTSGNTPVVNIGQSSTGPLLPMQETTSTGNTPGKPSYANVTCKPSRTKVNFRTLFTPGGKRVAYPVVANYGLNAMLENGSWFIRNNPLILKKWNPVVNLLKEDVCTILAWVKLYGVPVTTFSKDGLTVIATKQAMIDLRADVELKDNIVVAMPKINREGHYTCNIYVEYDWKPHRCVFFKVFSHIHEECPKNIGFKPNKEYRPVPKKHTANYSGNKKKGVDSINKVSDSNPFEVLNSVDNDVEMGIDGRMSNLDNNEANSSGSSFWNVENSSTSTTPIMDKIEKFKNVIINGKAILMDEAGNPLKKVECPGDHDSKDEVASVDNDMARSLASERT